MPSRSNNKGKEEEEEEEKTNNKSINTRCSSPTPSRTSASNNDHHLRHLHGIIIEDDQQVYIDEHKAKINGVSSTISRTTDMTSGTKMQPTPAPLKSNLKKSTVIHEEVITGIRKVSWPDAYGKDIAHIKEFEPSVSTDDGDLEGVRNSCVCVIL